MAILLSMASPTMDIVPSMAAPAMKKLPCIQPAKTPAVPYRLLPAKSHQDVGDAASGLEGWGVTAKPAVAVSPAENGDRPVRAPVKSATCGPAGGAEVGGNVVVGWPVEGPMKPATLSRAAGEMMVSGMPVGDGIEAP